LFISFSPIADPIKLFFFANEEFFRFLLVSLHFCYIQKKWFILKWPSLTPKKKKTEKKKFGRIDSRFGREFALAVNLNYYNKKARHKKPLDKTKVHTERFTHRDILLEATSSQKVRATKVSCGDQGGGLLSVIDPQSYRVWNEIEIFQISNKNISYALNHCCNRL
jgi:hypothetical protein